MYYLSKFCRICVQTGVKLLDLDTLDFDEVKLSEKLEACTKMVVSNESLSTEICLQCITKLRISYQFYDMCKKSTKTLQGYLEALFCKHSKKEVNPKSFVNTGLNVYVTPLTYMDNYSNQDISDDVNGHREKRKRITKEQRCSLLKQLLTPTENHKKERDKYFLERTYLNNYRGGLRNIIQFTKNYEFGLKLDKDFNYETSHLDKLTAFSNEFFNKDFSEFQSTILYIIENRDELCDSGDSEDEDLLSKPEESEDESKENMVTFEEVIVEPDIKIKTEMEYEDECGDMFTYEEPVDQIPCKKEAEEQTPEGPPVNHSCFSMPIPFLTNYSEYMRNFTQAVPSDSSIQLLRSLVGGYHHMPHNQRRTFSQSNVRCRTRDNPYINPLLKDQFLHRCFKCEKCNRYFKSPGYLKAHYSKVH